MALSATGDRFQSRPIFGRAEKCIRIQVERHVAMIGLVNQATAPGSDGSRQESALKIYS